MPTTHLNIRAGSGVLSVAVAGPPALLATAALTNVSAAATPATTFLPFGHPFARGDIPASSRLRATWTPAGGAESAPLPVQVSGRVSWDDGSLKFAAVGVALPSVAASGSGSLGLYAEAGAQAAALPAGKTAAQVATDLATNHAFAVSAANLTKGHTPAADGSGSWAWAASTQLALLGATDSRGRVRCEAVESGPLCVTFHSWGPFRSAGADHPHLVVRAWHRCWLDPATGAIDRVEHFHNVEQGWIEDLAGGAAAADLQVGDFAVSRNGTPVPGRSWAGVRVPHHTIHALTALDGTAASGNVDTAGSTWTTDAPTLRAAHDRAYWNRTGVMPPYDLTLGLADDPTPDGYAPGAADGFGKYAFGLNGTGDRAAIGVLASWSARAYIGQQAGWLRSDLANALIHGRMPCWVRNPSTGRLPVVVPSSVIADTPASALGATRDPLYFDSAFQKDSSVLLGAGSADTDGDTSNTEGGWSGPFYSSHWPHPLTHQCLRTGAPWLVELAKLSASQTVVCRLASTGTVAAGADYQRQFARPDAATAYGNFVWNHEERWEGQAWPAWVALLVTLPDAAVERPYIQSVYAGNVETARQIVTAGSTAFRAIGCWTPPQANAAAPARPGYTSAPWMQHYVALARGWEYLAMGRPAAVRTWLDHYKKMMRGMAGGDPLQACGWAGATYHNTFGSGADYYADWGHMPYYKPDFIGLSFDAATGWVAGLSTADVNGGTQALAAGDWFFLDAMTSGSDGAFGSAPPASGTSGGATVAIDPTRPYYLAGVDTAGNRVKLSPNADGSNPFTAFASSPTNVGVAVRLSACPVPSATQGTCFRDESSGAVSYAAILAGCIRLFRLGGVVVDASDPWAAAHEARVETMRSLRNWSGSAQDWADEPKYRFAATTP